MKRLNLLRLNNNSLRLNGIEFNNWIPRSAMQATYVLMIAVHYYIFSFFVCTNVIVF